MNLEEFSLANQAYSVPKRTDQAWDTPMYKQYWSIKDTVPDALLFFRLGDFYELFGEDAITAAPILQIQLTSRNKADATAIPMCGIPVHAVESYSEKLLAKGHKIALCEQITEPDGKTKLVERKVVRVLTPGLAVNIDTANEKDSHYLMVLYPKEDTIELGVFDLLTHDYYTGIIAANEFDELYRIINPKECLLPIHSKVPSLLRKEQVSLWSDEKNVTNLLKSYLIYTQRCEKHELTNKLLPEAKSLFELYGGISSQYARLPQIVVEQWGVFPQLFQILDHTGSAIGARRLKKILLKPLRNYEQIISRQKFLDVLEPLADKIRSHSLFVYDIERMLGRFRIGVAHPKELVKLFKSLQAVHDAISILPTNESVISIFFHNENLSDLTKSINVLRDVLSLLLSTIDIESESYDHKISSLLKTGFDKKLDEFRSVTKGSEAWLLSYEAKLRESTGIPSLKVRYNQVFGFYIEVTKTHLSKIPTNFERKQTMVNAERFVTQELKEREYEILTSENKLESYAKEIFQDIVKKILDHDKDIKNVIQHFSYVDAFSGLARAFQKLSRFGAWTLPEVIKVSDETHFEYVEGRHPIIETLMEGDFVANSLSMNCKSKTQLFILTGPNMAGKSTLMRQTGLLLLLAQCGLKVPAKSMKFTPVSGFYSRMGASDNIFAGESTFMVEMKECAQILREADSRSFVLIDEIGRGTSTEDGLAIARAILHYIHNKLGALTIFATHYHELSCESEMLQYVSNISMAIEDWNGKLYFLRKLKNEAAQSSYGIYVARLSGLPELILKDAKHFFTEESIKNLSSHQLSLFDRCVQTSIEPKNNFQWVKIIEKIKNLKMDELSPKSAWQLLEELHQEIVAQSP